MKNDIRLRPFRVTDIARVRDMFCEAFELECYSQSRFVMRHLLDHYLCTYLMDADYAMTAFSDKGVEGFIIGCIGTGRNRIAYRLLRTYHRAFLPLSRGGRSYMRCKALIEEADASLKESAPEADGELVLFVVRKESRGKGVGRLMLGDFKRILTERSLKSMQLFTDDYCDVDYYRARGYRQQGVRYIEFMPGDARAFYLFSIPVEKIGGREE